LAHLIENGSQALDLVRERVGLGHSFASRRKLLLAMFDVTGEA